MHLRPNGSAARGSAVPVILVLLLAVALAAANIGVLLMSVQRAGNAPAWLPLTDLYTLCPGCFIYLVAAPILFGVLCVLILAQRTTPAATPVRAEVKEPPPLSKPSPAAALRLLALLQREARLVDFVKEDIDGYSDEQVGAAVRAIHAGCRKALEERIELQRIYPEEDGSAVVVDKGFDPAAIRLTGNVSGQPPFRGTLQHGGWRATSVSLPDVPEGFDVSIVAPAEIEIA